MLTLEEQLQQAHAGWMHLESMRENVAWGMEKRGEVPGESAEYRELVERCNAEQRYFNAVKEEMNQR